MPWRIDKVGDKYKLYNLDKKRYVNKTFNSRESASSARQNYGRYSYGKKNNPPLDNVYTTLEAARKSQWRPKTHTKKEWEELGAGPKKKPMKKLVKKDKKGKSKK